MLRGKDIDRTLATSSIGHRMKIRGVRISLQDPLDATPLAPELLLHLKDLDKLILEVVSQSPTLLIQGRGVCHLIQLLDLM